MPSLLARGCVLALGGLTLGCGDAVADNDESSERASAGAAGAAGAAGGGGGPAVHSDGAGGAGTTDDDCDAPCEGAAFALDVSTCAWEIALFPVAPEQWDPTRFGLVVVIDGLDIYLPRVTDESECEDLEGWFFDAAADPTRVLLCPASCDELEQSSGAEAKGLLGCSGPLPVCD